MRTGESQDIGQIDSARRADAHHWGVAQLVEHRALTSAIVGSIPTTPTKFDDRV